MHRLSEAKKRPVKKHGSAAVRALHALRSRFTGVFGPRRTDENGCSATGFIHQAVAMLWAAGLPQLGYLALIALGFGVAPAFSQMSSPAGATVPATQPNVGADPTQREIQPPLDVDRDPVVSPDINEKTTADEGKALSKDAATNVYTLRQNVDEVLLRCAVVDGKGNLVTNLKQSDFRVWEDGVSQTLSSFQHRDQPASIGLLIDNSGSMLEKRSAVNDAAIELMKASNPQDAAFVVHFSDRAYLDQRFTSDLTALEKGLGTYPSTGRTALYDAVSASADEMAAHAKWPEQVLLIITDGRDDASRLTLEQTVHRVQQLGGPVVYAIGLLYESDSKQEAQRERDVLETLAADTGGLAYFPSSLEEVNGIARLVARDIRNQYILGYHSSKPIAIAGYRTVRVEAEANGYNRLVVRTRKGYYPKQNAAAAKPASGVARSVAPQGPH